MYRETADKRAFSRPPGLEIGERSVRSGAGSSQQRRYYVEPARFTTLKRGGPAHDYQVECIVYNGGMKFRGAGEDLPYTLIPFDQLSPQQRAAVSR